MTTTTQATSGSAVLSGDRLLPMTGITVALMWVAARIVPDGILQGTTQNLITHSDKAERIILDHQVAEVVEVMGTFFLAGLIILFAARTRAVLGDNTWWTAAFGCAVL